MRNITAILSKREHDDLVGISAAVRKTYANLADDEQSSLWHLLSACPCLATTELFQQPCKCCHGSRKLVAIESAVSWDAGQDSPDWREYKAVLEELLRLPDLQQANKAIRTLAALAVRSFVLHTQKGGHLDLGKSLLGQWTLKAFASQHRELRIAATRALVAFLRRDLPAEIRDNNRRLAVEYLRTLSDSAPLAQHETLILAWGQIAVVCDEQELNLALLRLVEYLGHPNSLTCSRAYVQLEQVSIDLDQAPDVLFRPFWPSIAVDVVRDVISVPQKIQHLVEILKISVNQFLELTQRETLPLMVLTKRKDVLQRIASARASNCTVQDVCMHPRSNMAAILALLLRQPSNDIEATIPATLTAIAPDLGNLDLSALLKLDPVSVVTEMLKSAGDEEPNRKSRVYQAIQTLAVLERPGGQGRSGVKQGRVLASFFETYVLGIMTNLSESIERDDGSIPRNEKARCLHAIEEMIVLARSHIAVAIPQIRACLQSALDQEGLADKAISAWLTLMRTIEAEDVIHLLDHLFAVTVQHWVDLSSPVQQQVYDTIAHLLKTHSNLIREEVMTIPSLAQIPLMSKFEAEINRLRESEGAEKHLTAFSRRLRDENPSVVLQALREFVPWLESNQAFVHESAVSDPPSVVIPTVIRALLDAVVRQSESQGAIAGLSSQCLGIIGCLDPNTIEANSTKQQVLVLSNFEKAADVVEWIASLFETTLVPAFSSTTNARAQGFLAYVIQELLRYATFNQVASMRLRASQSDPTYQRWIELPENVRNILTPFLTSRYVLTATVSHKTPNTYPIFSTSFNHNSWLRTWVFDMLWRAKGDNPAQFFPMLARVIKHHDIAIAKFLLPYIALNIVLGGAVSEVADVAKEMLTVLSTESNIDGERNVLRQCSEVSFRSQHG